MSACVFLNLLNKLGKRDKMRGLLSILLLFCKEFDKFKHTGALMLDSIYHKKSNIKFLHNNIFGCYGRHYTKFLKKKLVVYQL